MAGQGYTFTSVGETIDGTSTWPPQGQDDGFPSSYEYEIMQPNMTATPFPLPRNFDLSIAFSNYNVTPPIPSVSTPEIGASSAVSAVPMTADQQERQGRWLESGIQGTTASLKANSNNQDVPEPSRIRPVSTKTRKFICTWLEFKGFKSDDRRSQCPSVESIAHFARSQDLELGAVTEVVYEELGHKSYIVAAPTSTPGPSMDSAKSMDATTIAALEVYLEKAARMTCNNLQRRKRKDSGRYQCTSKSCNYRTESRESWQRHMDIRQPRDICVCANCPTKDTRLPFTEHRVDKFRAHVKRAHKKSSSAAIEVARRSGHPQTPDQPLYCGFCSRHYGVHKQFRGHVQEHFDQKKASGEAWNVRTDRQERKLASGFQDVDHNTDTTDTITFSGRAS